ncbi:MAG: DUF4301 family protein [Thermodesulfobacteriota bacterium]
MGRLELSQQDIKQIKNHGLTEARVEEQVALFEKGAPYANLDRACTIGDGIRQFDAETVDRLINTFEQRGRSREMVKFVPASGAATRMFKALLKIYHQHSQIGRDTLAEMAEKHGAEYADVLEFIDRLDSFAFYDALRKQMETGGHNIESLRKSGDLRHILAYVLTEKGLDYGQKPKGLIQFHRYPDGARTAFEEHLVEAADYVRDAGGKCRLHFTVSPEHENRFRSLLTQTGPAYESAHSAEFDVAFSRQHPATDTIAVDMENRPFRDQNGRLVFRPGGHGALIENINNLGADIVFIKNVDNVVPDRLKAETYLWKKVLAGCLLELEEQIRGHLRQLETDDHGLDLGAAEAFVENELGVRLPPEVKSATLEKKRRYLIDRLDRPLRVCGMVPSSGEPGGGPFWVKDPDGSESIQIVENAQVDPASEKQQAIVRELTHFNPVDIVCSLRNERGQPYDLRRFVDGSAVFISHKSKDGRDLKALEHPGLWNGGMAFWNTVFVEVPLITFNPVKTVNDLLRDVHQG